MSNLQIIEGLASYAAWWLLAILIFALVVFSLWSLVAILTYRHEAKRHAELVRKYKSGYMPRNRNDWSE